MTGITNDSLIGADTFAQVATRLRKFILDNKGDCSEVILAGYNARDYDIALFRNELLRLGVQYSLSITDFGDKVMDILHLVRNNNVWDAIQVAPPAQKSLKNVHLALCGEEAADLHSARGDVNAMKAVIQRLDPELSISLVNYTYPICYKNVDLSTLNREERLVAATTQGKPLCFDISTPLQNCSITHLLSLCDSSYSYSHTAREDWYAMRNNNFYNNVPQCQEIIDSFSSRLKAIDELEDETARHWECHEISDSTQTSYPKTSRSGRTIELHIAACTAGNGVAITDPSNVATMLTASHICQNSRCINKEHLRWETMLYNLSRIGCYGYANHGSHIEESDDCQHNPKCMTILPCKEWW